MTEDVTAPRPSDILVNTDNLRQTITYIKWKFENGQRSVVFTRSFCPHCFRDGNSKSVIPDDICESVSASFKASGWVNVYWDKTGGKLPNQRFNAENPDPPTAPID